MEEQIDEQDNKDIIFIQKIGVGCQGQVYQVQIPSGQARYALKIINTNFLSEEELKRARFEIESNLKLSTQIHSPNFPILQNYWVGHNSINLLFQLCESNSEAYVKNLVSYRQRYNFLTVMSFDILMALRVLQHMKIIHRDVKSENILVKQGIFKLSDLGLSRLYESDRFLTSNIGNRLGRSPQFISGKYTCKTDIWSLGIHVFYMLENTLPFDQESLLKIKKNPNDIEKIISSDNMTVDLQPSGRKSKNILSFLHLLLFEMVVIDPQQRKEADYIISAYFNNDRVLQIKDIVKIGFLGYLYERERFGQYYLIIMMGYLDYYKLDSKLKQDCQANKKKICLKVKVVIYQIIVMVRDKVAGFYNQRLNCCLALMLKTWEQELVSERAPNYRLENINEALDIYKISKVKQKFILVEWMVKLYQIKEMEQNGAKIRKIPFWQLPIELYKII